MVASIAVVLLHATAVAWVGEAPTLLRSAQPAARTALAPPALRLGRVVCSGGGGGSGPDEERVDALLQALSDAENGGAGATAPAAAETPPPADADAEPFDLGREIALLRRGEGEIALFLKEFVPTFAFFLAIRIAIVEPRYIP
jgi:hypothetical protein